MIKAGSSVKHVPTGETWRILGVNKNKNSVCVAGYPPTIAKLSDCIENGERIQLTQAAIEYRNSQFGTDWED